MVSSERISQNKTNSEAKNQTENNSNSQKFTDTNTESSKDFEIKEKVKPKNTENIEILDSEILENEENVYFNEFNEKVEIPEFLL
jgi:hypothetical protein